MSIKSEEEIQIMREGGRILGEILEALLKKVKPGVKTIDLDILASELIDKRGGYPSFKTVRGYKWTTCMCVNEEVVHGIPDDTLKEGDILCIDIGMLYKGLHTDTAWTIPVGKVSEDTTRFLKTGKDALEKAISQSNEGNRIGDISKAIQETIEGASYSVVKALVGHGIGKKLHEDPQVPGFLNTKIESTPILKSGMTLAIEVIYNRGRDEVVYKNNDGWTMATRDNSLSAVFEATVLIAGSKAEILTKRQSLS